MCSIFLSFCSRLGSKQLRRWAIVSLREASKQLGRDPREVRTLVLARRIPTIRVGRANALDAAGVEALKEALAELDREAESRKGALVTV